MFESRGWRRPAGRVGHLGQISADRGLGLLTGSFHAPLSAEAPMAPRLLDEQVWGAPEWPSFDALSDCLKLGCAQLSDLLCVMPIQHLHGGSHVVCNSFKIRCSRFDFLGRTRVSYRSQRAFLAAVIY
jgi:hypothetical protein